MTMTALERFKEKINKLPDKFRIDFASRTHDYQQGYETALKDIKKIIEKIETKGDWCAKCGHHKEEHDKVKCFACKSECKEYDYPTD